MYCICYYCNIIIISLFSIVFCICNVLNDCIWWTCILDGLASTTCVCAFPVSTWQHFTVHKMSKKSLVWKNSTGLHRALTSIPSNTFCNELEHQLWAWTYRRTSVPDLTNPKMLQEWMPASKRAKGGSYSSKFGNNTITLCCNVQASLYLFILNYLHVVAFYFFFSFSTVQ